MEQLSPQEKEQWWVHASRALGRSGLREHDDRLDRVRQSLARVTGNLKRDRSAGAVTGFGSDEILLGAAPGPGAAKSSFANRRSAGVFPSAARPNDDFFLMSSANGKEETTATVAYRKVIGDLAACEERYQSLLEAMPASSGAQLEAALAALQSEVRHRKRVETELLSAVEAERQRIGQDLHDDICQRLGATAMMTSALGVRIAVQDAQVATELQKVAKLISETIESCRLLSRGLHPFTLTAKGLPAALDELAERMPSGIKFTWPRGRRISLTPEAALHLYRITEEAVGNAVRHGEAKKIIIQLGKRDGHTVLAIEDNGKGFTRTATTEGMGLRNMEYRADVIGAKLTIGPGERGGTRVICSLPHPKA